MDLSAVRISGAEIRRSVSGVIELRVAKVIGFAGLLAPGGESPRRKLPATLSEGCESFASSTQMHLKKNISLFLKIIKLNHISLNPVLQLRFPKLRSHREVFEANVDVTSSKCVPQTHYCYETTHLPWLALNFGRKSFQKAHAVARGPFPIPLLSALKMKYWGWSLVYRGQLTSSVTGFLEECVNVRLQ